MELIQLLAFWFLCAMIIMTNISILSANREIAKLEEKIEELEKDIW